jgi:hypothetical protein
LGVILQLGVILGVGVIEPHSVTGVNYALSCNKYKKVVMDFFGVMGVITA